MSTYASAVVHAAGDIENLRDRLARAFTRRPAHADSPASVPRSSEVTGIMVKRFTGSALIVAALALPVAARADTSNVAAPRGDWTILGMIDSIEGKYDLTMCEDRAGRLSVTMHRGTIIKPIGLQLKPGMQITVAGHADGSRFDADEIDAPVDIREAELRTRSIRGTILRCTPGAAPNGTFQTNGPTAAGGG
jgi:hypothetical protein